MDAENRPLTPKQQKFVEEYVKSLNATDAYRKAGYKGKGNSAKSSASEILANLDVKAAIDAAIKARSERAVVEADDVLREWSRIGQSDIGDIIDFSGNEPRMKLAREISLDARRAISSVKVKRYVEGKGPDARTVEVMEFKLWDKPNSLQQLGKHLGLLKDTLELTGKNGKSLRIRFVEVAKPNANPAAAV